MQPYQSRIPAGPPFAAFGPENVEKQKNWHFYRYYTLPRRFDRQLNYFYCDIKLLARYHNGLGR
jgi:hypothetical protein